MGELTYGVVHQPIDGQTHCGDAYRLIERDDFWLLAVVDGLGHGAEAEMAARRVLDHVEAHADRHPLALLEGCHEAAHGTRGAVMAVARVERARGVVIHAGLGNIDTRLVGEDKVYRPLSPKGILGHQARGLRFEEFPFTAGDLLVMHSDGIADHFTLSSLARERDLPMLARQIATAYGQAHDDQLLVIVKEGAT